jgi:hypothetical protein
VHISTDASYRLGRGHSRFGVKRTHDIRRESYIDNISVRIARHGTTNANIVLSQATTAMAKSKSLRYIPLYYHHHPGKDCHDTTHERTVTMQASTSISTKNTDKQTFLEPDSNKHPKYKPTRDE